MSQSPFHHSGTEQDVGRAIQQMQQARLAQDELYKRFKDQVVARIQRDFPPKLRARMDAEDVYQEAFMRALDRIHTFEWRGEDSFRGFIMTIAKNYITDTLRRRSAQQHRLDRQDSVGGQIDVEQPGARASVLMRDREAVDTYLSLLRPEEEEVVRLRILDKLSFAEVGERVGKSDEAVRKVFNRALQSLSDRLQESEEG